MVWYLYIAGGLLATFLTLRLVSAQVYDTIIVHMTKLWYQVVLERIDKDTAVLDLGIGTATALLRNKETVKNKNLTIVGVDYDQAYINAANKVTHPRSITHQT